MSASDSYVGKYTKQKLLGKGTFGEAWLVVSTASGRYSNYNSCNASIYASACGMWMLMALFVNGSRSYVMKELLSVGWDSQEKDKNMTEVCYFIHIQSYYE